MSRKHRFLLGMMILIIITTSAFAQLDLIADYYQDNYSGFGLDAAKISNITFNGGDNYRDLVVTRTVNGGHVYVNRHLETMPYFILHPSITLVPGAYLKFNNNGLILGIAKETVTMYINSNNGTLQYNQTISSSINNRIAFGQIFNDPSINDIAGCQGPPGEQFSNAVHRFNENYEGFFNQVLPDLIADYGYTVTSVTFADLDKYELHTLPELIITTRSYFQGFYSVHVIMYANDGYGNFTMRDDKSWSVLNTIDIQDLAVGDLNADDYADIVLVTNNHLYTLINLGEECPGYLMDVDHPPLTGQNVFSQIALINMDYDRFPDLVCVDRQASQLKVYMDTEDLVNGHFETNPTWIGTMGESTDNNLGIDYELIAADITGTGALSLICSGITGPTPPLLPGFWVFMDHGDPRAHHPTNFQVLDSGPEHHPLLQWKPNTEDDLSHYYIYRALMQDETPPVEQDFSLIDSVSNGESQYIDYDVYMTSQYANYKIWYYVTAVDLANNESLASNFVRFWGLYRPESEGPESYASNVLKIGVFTLNASPNPFNPATTIRYQLPTISHVSLKIYDTTGRLISTLVNASQPPGTHQVTFDGTSLPSGVYLYRLTARANTATGKMVLLK